MLVRVEYKEVFEGYKAMNSNIVEVSLTTDDIPGSELGEPFSKHKADSLRKANRKRYQGTEDVISMVCCPEVSLDSFSIW